MNRAIKFWNIAIEEAEEEFDVTSEHLVVFVREVALPAVGFQVFGAEHPDEALELETVERKIKSDGKPQPGLTQYELKGENWHGGEGDGDHETQRRSVSRVAQNPLAEAVEELVVSAGENLIGVVQGTNFAEKRGYAVETKRRRADQRHSRYACQSHGD